jgi:predicted nucleic acid-binding protein
MPESYVLDASAIIALVLDQPGAQRVDELLRDASLVLAMSAINLGEVYAVILRRKGRALAQQTIQAALDQPNLAIDFPSWEAIRSAAELKVQTGLAFADSFAATLARERHAILVTGDREFADLERRGIVNLELLPVNS